MADTKEKVMLGVLLTPEARGVFELMFERANEDRFPKLGKSEFLEMLIRAEAKHLGIPIPKVAPPTAAKRTKKTRKTK